MSLFVQKWQTDFVGALSNKEVQQALIKFLVASWEDDANPNIIQDFQIYVSCGNLFFSFKTEGEKVKKVAETSLKCSHEEVDSGMLFNARFINAPNDLVIRTADTEIVVITLWNMPKLFQELKASLEVDLTSNKYTVLYKCERNKQKSWIQILLYYTWLSCFN